MQYYKDQLNATSTNFESFKCKVKITEKNPDDGNARGAEIAVPLKYKSNF